jgi:hypothetical protein
MPPPRIWSPFLEEVSKLLVAYATAIESNRLLNS